MAPLAQAPEGIQEAIDFSPSPDIDKVIADLQRIRDELSTLCEEWISADVDARREDEQVYCHNVNDSGAQGRLNQISEKLAQLRRGASRVFTKIQNLAAQNVPGYSKAFDLILEIVKMVDDKLMEDKESKRLKEELLAFSHN